RQDLISEKEPAQAKEPLCLAPMDCCEGTLRETVLKDPIKTVLNFSIKTVFNVSIKTVFNVSIKTVLDVSIKTVLTDSFSLPRLEPLDHVPSRPLGNWI
ncbi:MAG: hypothetical protein ACJASJ_001379, partial [Candidatus Azotimanducaceae bacterium]